MVLASPLEGPGRALGKPGISLYIQAECLVLDEGPSAPCAWRCHCAQKLQAAEMALPVCIGEGPTAKKPKVRRPRPSLLKGR